MISSSLPGHGLLAPSRPVRGKFVKEPTMNEETGELPTSLPDLLTAVAYFEAEAERADRAIREWEAQKADLYERRTLMRRLLKEFDGQLRLALVNAHLNGEELPPKTSIRYDRKPLFRVEEMTAWALAYQPDLLKLDEVAVRKLAPKLKGAPITIEQVPVAVIGNLAELAPAEIEGVVAA